MTPSLLRDCLELTQQLAGSEPLYFDSALQVKTSPHAHPFAAWAVCLHPGPQLQVMDADDQWHCFDMQDRDAALLLGSLYQRLRLMHAQRRKAS